MTPDRLDDLLDRALAQGAVPADATAEERAEVERMLLAAGALRANAAMVESEASRAMPTARARFQRHLAAERPAPPVAAVRPSAKGGLGRFLGGRMMTFASSAAAIAVIAVVALVVLQPFSGVETAAALTVDDYVQVQGVVSAAGDGTVTVQAPEIGNLEVALSDLTAVTDGSGARDPGSLRPGDPVLVSGVVTAKRAITATNVAVAENQAAPTPGADRTKIPVLKNFRQGLQGTVRLISLSPNGANSRVLLVTANEQFLVEVEPRTMDELLAGARLAVGSRVRVVDGAGLPKGVFRLEPIENPPATPPAEPSLGTPPQFENVRGVVVGRNMNVLMVRTDRGTVPVVLRLQTSIRFGDSGLTPDDVRAGESVIGYQVSISGNLDPANGRRVIASIVVVLGKAPERPAP